MASVRVGFALLSCRHRWARCWPDAEGKQILSTDVETLPTHIAVTIDNAILQCILSCGGFCVLSILDFCTLLPSDVYHAKIPTRFCANLRVQSPRKSVRPNKIHASVWRWVRMGCMQRLTVETMRIGLFYYCPGVDPN
ncbi:hypothetical protein M413DRAFT_350020 [Hebeloma cylindrosporum]|uniref:Uncharacterized protein n=1 Tax=Hebeloma cylindrosporum TaxID=76867 RepID=A0A0C2Y2M9_HEBCY|nr:hypothetical protein M413DRAFT_350020 [Hebeloma cylindrosporum h7]